MFTAIIIFVISVFGALATPLLIRLLYGKKYLDAIPLSRVLWIMRMTDCAIRVVPVTFLPALGDTKYNYIASPVYCLIHAIIDYFLILNLGINGVAYATIIINVISGIIAWTYIRWYCLRRNKES